MDWLGNMELPLVLFIWRGKSCQTNQASENDTSEEVELSLISVKKGSLNERSTHANF